MSFLKHCFNLIDNIPVIEPVGLHIPEFKNLWLYDKTKDKTEVRKLLVYIYHTYSYGTAYSSLPEPTKTMQIMNDTEVDEKLLTKYESVLKPAIDKFKVLAVPVSKDALDTAVNMLNKTKIYLNGVNLSDTDKQGRLLISPDSYVKSTKAIAETLSTISELERQVAADAAELEQSYKARGGALLTEMEDWLDEITDKPVSEI